MVCPLVASLACVPKYQTLLGETVLTLLTAEKRVKRVVPEQLLLGALVSVGVVPSVSPRRP